jgi:hypothetical protein
VGDWVMMEASQDNRRDCFVVPIGKGLVSCSVSEVDASEKVAHFLLNTFEGDNMLGMKEGHSADKFHLVLNFAYFLVNEIVDEGLISNWSTKNFDTIR